MAAKKRNYPQSAQWHTIADTQGVKTIAFTGSKAQAEAAGKKLLQKGYGVNLMPAPPDAETGWQKHWQRELKNPAQAICVRCARKPARYAVRVPRGNRDAVCESCVTPEELHAADTKRMNPKGDDPNYAWFKKGRDAAQGRIAGRTGDDLKTAWKREAISDRTAQKYFAMGWERAILDSLKRKRNPEAAAAQLSETFHGRPAKEIEVSKTRIQDHEYLTKLGDLTELQFTSLTGYTVKMSWVEPKTNAVKKDAPSLGVSEDGKQLYIEGGNQQVDLPAFQMNGEPWERDSMTLGVLTKITYRTSKKFDQFKTIDYFHALGEETGFQPLLNYDPHNGLMSIAGGQYKIETESLVEGMSPGIVN